MYHGIGSRHAGEDPDNLFVPAATFRSQLADLRRRGFVPLDLDTYLAGPIPRRAFLLTFDDGYVSVLDTAGPILAEFAAPAVCFVCPGRLGAASDWSAGRPEPLLDDDGVRALAGFGIEIGAHGWDHTAMPGLPPDVLPLHTSATADELLALTGTRPRAFAYPFGAHDPASRRAVVRAGYTVAFATYDGAGPVAVPRVDVNAVDTPRSFRMKTWRAYPAARRALGAAPRLRSGVHRMLGRAAR